MSEILSLFVWCRHDLQTDTMQLQIVNVDTGKEVRLDQGTFLLRIFNLQEGAVQRCFIRHIASGREAYVQGGKNLRSFVKACILQSAEFSPESSIPERLEDVPSESQTHESGSRPESSTPNESKGDADT
jgi:hypothetical protein